MQTLIEAPTYEEARLDAARMLTRIGLQEPSGWGAAFTAGRILGMLDAGEPTTSERFMCEYRQMLDDLNGTARG